MWEQTRQEKMNTPQHDWELWKKYQYSREKRVDPIFWSNQLHTSITESTPLQLPSFSEAPSLMRKFLHQFFLTKLLEHTTQWKGEHRIFKKPSAYLNKNQWILKIISKAKDKLNDKSWSFNVSSMWNLKKRKKRKKKKRKKKHKLTNLGGSIEMGKSMLAGFGMCSPILSISCLTWLMMVMVMMTVMRVAHLCLCLYAHPWQWIDDKDRI